MKQQTRLILSTITITATGGVLWRCLMPRIPLSKYTKTCLYFAIMDDEICRNELEGNMINGQEIIFPSKIESIHYRYQLFLNTYKKYSRKELAREMSRLKKRLEASKQYINNPREELEI